MSLLDREKCILLLNKDYAADIFGSMSDCREAQNALKSHHVKHCAQSELHERE